MHCARVLFFSFFSAETFWSSLLRYSQLTHLSQATKVATCDSKGVAPFNVTVEMLA